MGARFLLKGRRLLATNMNTSFFMGNEVSNMFSSNNLFEKSNIFGENRENNFEGHGHFIVEVISR